MFLIKALVRDMRCVTPAEHTSRRAVASASAIVSADDDNDEEERVGVPSERGWEREGKSDSRI